MLSRLIAIGLTFILGLAQAQTVDITTLGVGSTPSDAETVALRSALEQCYGVYLSAKSELRETSTTVDGETSHTSTLFENMATITSGEIVSYQVLEQTEESIQGQPSRFHVVVQSRVSVEAVANYALSKGVEVQLAGGMFAQNIKLHQLNEEAEITALENLVDQTALMLNNCVNFEVQYKDPTEHLDGLWQLNVIAIGSWNSNFDQWIKVVRNSLVGISCSLEEESTRVASNQGLWRLRLIWEDGQSFDVVLRTPESIFLISDLFLLLRRSLFNFNVDLGIATISGFEALHQTVCQLDSGPKINGELASAPSGLNIIPYRPRNGVNYSLPLVCFRSIFPENVKRTPRRFFSSTARHKVLYAYDYKAKHVYDLDYFYYMTTWLNQGYHLDDLRKNSPADLTRFASNNISGLVGRRCSSGFNQNSPGVGVYSQESTAEGREYNFITWNLTELKKSPPASKQCHIAFAFPRFLRLDELEQIQSIEISPARLLE